MGETEKNKKERNERKAKEKFEISKNVSDKDDQMKEERERK